MSYKNRIRNWVIYRIVNPSGRVYVGKSCSFKNRIRNYKSGGAQSQKILKRSLDKYGFDAHVISIIDEFKSDCSYASGKEMFWIRSHMSNYSKYKEQNGMNLTDGGEGALGVKKSDDERLRMRERMLGVKHSEEWKSYMRTIMTGRTYPKGRKMTEEQRKNMSASRKGKKLISERAKAHHAEMIRKMCKAVAQYSKDGEYINSYISLADAAKCLSIQKNSIWMNCVGKLKTAGGYKFKYI